MKNPNDQLDRARFDLRVMYLKSAGGEDVDLVELEDVLARMGIAVVSREMGELVKRIEASPETATSDEFSAASYAIYASVYGDYWPLQELDPDPAEVEFA